MESLTNLHDFIEETINNFDIDFFSTDRELPESFKQYVKSHKDGDKYTFNKFSTIYRTELSIYCPNQWFYIAAYFCKIYPLLKEYKEKVLTVVGNNMAVKDLKPIFEKFAGNKLEAQEAFNKSTYDTTTKSHLVEFVSNYSWWRGGKGIERQDFYYSPILSAANLVNQSQSYVAEISRYLIENPQALKFLQEELENRTSHSTMARVVIGPIRYNTNGEGVRMFMWGILKHFYGLDKLKNMRDRGILRFPTNTWAWVGSCPASKIIKSSDTPAETLTLDDGIILGITEDTNANRKDFDEAVKEFNEAYNGEYMITVVTKDDGKDEFYLMKIHKIDYPLQQIFYGAPGTGKSNTIKREVDEKGKINYRVTFHPDSDYSTFVGCYKPGMESPEKIYSYSELVAKLKEVKLSGVSYPCHKFSAQYWESVKELSAEQIKQMLLACGFTESMNVEVSKGVAIGEELSSKTKDKKIVYKFTPQAFTKAYTAAWNTTEDVFLIIEEINRGNCAQIFGDLFQLLDRNKDGYSEYPVDPDSDLADYLGEKLKDSTRTDLPQDVKEGKKLVLPNNLYIWATMNTSDQSLFPIDSAFKRRWDWQYIPINTEKENWTISVKNAKYSWSDFLSKMNEIVYNATSSEDKEMGFYFCKAKDGVIDSKMFVGKVLFYLWNDVFKDRGLPEEIKGSADEYSMSYPRFYCADGSINEDLVIKVLENLEIKHLDDDDPKLVDDGLTEEDLKGNGGKVNFTSVTFNDGTVIREDDRFATYVAALKHFGLDKAAEIAENSKLHRHHLPLICKTVQQTPPAPYTYEEVDGVYIMKGTNSMHRMLIKIGKELGIDFRLDE